MPTETHSFTTIQRLNRDFEADRPLLAALNNPQYDYYTTPEGKVERRLINADTTIDVTKVSSLLLEEILEFNGGADFGYFSEPENREDYRQQEVADMVLFGLAYYESLGVEANEASITSQLNTLLSELQIPEVPSSVAAAKVENFDSEQENTFLKLKTLLNKQGDILRQLPTVALTPDEQAKSIVVLEAIIAVCFAIYHLMKVNPIRQVAEKVARNYLRYPAHLLQLPQMAEVTTPAERYQIIQETFKGKAEQLKNQWDGEAIKVTSRSGTIYVRPGHGTDAFYSQGTYQGETSAAEQMQVA